MSKAYFGFVLGAVIMSLTSVEVSVLDAADGHPATLVCSVNATASRGYVFNDKSWRGVILSNSPNPPFEVSVAGKLGSQPDRSVERVFSGLDTETPKVRQIQQNKKAAEFEATVVNRRSTSVVIVWHNNPAMANWAWLAQIDRSRRVAIVTSVYDGWTYTGGEVETMDCR